MEPVRGLSIQDSCAAIAVGEKKLFVANVQTGKPVHFLWTFDLHHLHKLTHMGKEVRPPQMQPHPELRLQEFDPTFRFNSLNANTDLRDYCL